MLNNISCLNISVLLQIITIKHLPSLELGINTDFPHYGELLDYVVIAPFKFPSVLDTFCNI